MAWLVFLLGAALAIAGALSVASGLPYMRIEWGWTEVIAGTTAFSGGIVTIALGAVLLGLASLRRVVERGLAAAPRAVSDGALFAAEHADPGASQPTARAPAAALLEEPDTGTPALEPIRPVPESVQAPTPMMPEPDTAPELLADEDLADGIESRSEAVPRTPKRRPLLTQLRDSWGGRGKPPPDPFSAPAEPQLDAGLAPSPAGEPELAAPFDRPSNEDIAAAPSEVGRYEAGGASYALFSDGTIEVETETGLHRFASMEELKAFIDQQDRAGATPDH